MSLATWNCIRSSFASYLLLSSMPFLPRIRGWFAGPRSQCATDSRVKCQWVNRAARAFLRQRKAERAKDSEMKPKRHAIYFYFIFFAFRMHFSLLRTPAPVCHNVPTPLGRWNEIVIGEHFIFLRFGTFTLDYDDGAFAGVWETQCTAPNKTDSNRKK